MWVCTPIQFREIRTIWGNDLKYRILLLKCLATKSKAHKFDWCEKHYRDLQFNIEEFSPTSSSIEQHIKRAYFQCHLWLHAPIVKDISTGPLTNGYTLDECELLLPITGQFVSWSVTNSWRFSFTMYSCQVCTRKCMFLPENIACCKVCKCKAVPQCKNSHNQWWLHNYFIITFL